MNDLLDWADVAAIGVIARALKDAWKDTPWMNPLAGAMTRISDLTEWNCLAYHIAEALLEARLDGFLSRLDALEDVRQVVSNLRRRASTQPIDPAPRDSTIGWAIVELTNGDVVAGLWDTVSVAGVGMLRHVLPPAYVGDPTEPVSRIYNPAHVVAIRKCSPEKAREDADRQEAIRNRPPPGMFELLPPQNGCRCSSPNTWNPMRPFDRYGEEP